MVANYEKKKEGGHGVMYVVDYVKNTENALRSLTY